jgi:hypothetical protein
MLTKQYFKVLVKVTDTYKQNAGGGTAGQKKNESANQIADCSNKVCNYIAQIASAAVTNNDHAANTQAKDTQFEACWCRSRSSPRLSKNSWQTRATRTLIQTPMMVIKTTARDVAPRGNLNPSS